MNDQSMGMGARLVALAVMCAASGVQAQTATATDDAPIVASAPQAASADTTNVAPAPADELMTTSQPPADAAQNDPAPGGTVADLQALIQADAVAELRTTHNGSYGASLLFDSSEMMYYVTLFQQKNIWRVIKTMSDTRADGIYADFVRRSVQLSDVEIRRTKLEAQKAYTAKLIALDEKRAAYIQADLDNQRTQQEEVAAHQQETSQQAAQLDAQSRAEQAKLDQLRHEIAHLNAQTESGLPKRLR
jgi:hypothetical protein